MSNGQAMARLRRVITKEAATGAAPVIVREVFGDVVPESAKLRIATVSQRPGASPVVLGADIRMALFN